MRNNHTFLKQVLAFHILETRTSMARLKTDDTGETYLTAQGSKLQKFRWLPSPEPRMLHA